MQEINKTGGANSGGSKVDADDASKYRQLLVKTLHTCCIRFQGNFINLYFLFRAGSMYHGSKKEFYTSYLFKEQGTSEGSE